MSNHPHQTESSESPGAIGHPAKDEWMAFVYGEAAGAHRSEFASHLADCPACRQQVQEWRRVGQSLDEWKIPRRRRSAWGAQPWIKWGMAAALVLGLGFSLGRYSRTPSPALSSLRAALKPSLRSALEAGLEEKLAGRLAGQWQTNFQAARAQLVAEGQELSRELAVRLGADVLSAANTETRRLLAQYALLNEQKRKGEYENILGALRQLESQNASDYVFMRTDLEKLAVATESEIERSRQQIGRLAVYSRPADGPAAPDKP